MKNAAFSLVCLLFAIPCQARIIYVDANTPDNNDGSSWAKAYKYLQDALAVAQFGQQIWVAEGTYHPDQGNGISHGDKESTFRLKNGVAIYGGFQSGGCDWEDRNPVAYKSILSGDLNGDDSNISNLKDLLSEPTRIENSQHVVTGGGCDETAILDGIVITGGYAQWHHNGVGGGILNSPGSPTLNNCTLSENVAFDNGGAMYSDQNSDPVLTDCVFIGNIATVSGGGIADEGSPKLSKCTFTSNLAGENGGGVYSSNSNATLIDCVFTKNKADEGAGMYINDGNSLTLINCIFSENHASWGGGINNNNGNPSITDCTFSGNLATSRGAGMVNRVGNPTVTDCNFTGNLIVGPLGWGGGMYNKSSNPSLRNTTFIRNRASTGGGMSNAESNPTIIDCKFSENFTRGYPGSGGGMSNHGSNPTIVNCIFSENSATKYSGGGMWNYGGSSPEITDSLFDRNFSEHEGGGMHNSYGSTPSLKGCRFIGNLTKSGGGGGLYHSGKLHFKGGGPYNIESNPTIMNCVFSGNSAYNGGGMELIATSPTLINCIFIGNYAAGKYGSGGGMYNTFNSGRGSHPTLTNCIVWGNFDPGGTVESAQIHYDQSSSTINHSCIQSSTRVDRVGNINADPQFVDEGHWDGQPLNGGRWINGNYHLRSQGGRWDSNSQSWIQDDVTSPCIDAGDPNSSIGYEPFPNGGIINMGAYGGTEEASKSYFGTPVCTKPIAGDINGDCKVDFKDVAILAFHIGWRIITSNGIDLFLLLGLGCGDGEKETLKPTWFCITMKN